MALDTTSPKQAISISPFVDHMLPADAYVLGYTNRIEEEEMMELANEVATPRWNELSLALDHIAAIEPQPHLTDQEVLEMQQRKEVDGEWIIYNHEVDDGTDSYSQ